MKKKGQQMTLGTIIAIVLGIVVLVFLIFGFSTGWNNMWSKISNLGGGESNVDDVILGCRTACSSNSEYSYCTQKREVVTEDGSQGSYSCNEWNFKDSSLGIKECPNLCSVSEEGLSADGGSEW